MLIIGELLATKKMMDEIQTESPTPRKKDGEPNLTPTIEPQGLSHNSTHFSFNRGTSLTPGATTA